MQRTVEGRWGQVAPCTFDSVRACGSVSQNWTHYLREHQTLGQHHITLATGNLTTEEKLELAGRIQQQLGYVRALRANESLAQQRATTQVQDLSSHELFFGPNRANGRIPN